MNQYLRLIRLHHWIKNSLIGLVFLFNPEVWDLSNLGLLILLILFWGLVASAGYIINDILDIESDRHHETKKFRPLASGSVPVKTAAILSGLFLIIAFLGTYILNHQCFYILIGYFILSIAYSAYLKTIKYLDIIILTLFYMLRLVIGAALFELDVTNWFLSTSFFGFLSISLKKREMETYLIKENLSRRKYSLSDSNMLSFLSYAAAFTALIFLNLHTILYLKLENIYLLLAINSLSLYAILSFLDKDSIYDDPTKTFIKKPHFILIALVLIVVYVYIITSTVG